MPYVNRADLVSAVKVAEETRVIVNGTVQTAQRGAWVVVKAGTGKTTILDDEAFQRQFVGVNL